VPPSPALAPATRDERGDEGARRVLYSGFPSWRAYFGEYAMAVGLGIVVPVIAQGVARWIDATTFTIALTIAIPLAIAGAAVYGIGLYRRSKVVRITTTNIETEHGLFSKRIDVLELWRCRDIQYRQSLFDRVLRIAHIVIYAKDATTPHLEIVGLPASRELFEKVRDSFEVQRHSKNVRRYVD
jgi:uncharacterized membrane protein YdbT with pleckstrin-like domain